MTGPAFAGGVNDTALQRLAEAEVHPCDELEPMEGAAARARWIKDPAGVVHLLVEDARTTAPEPAVSHDG